MVGTESWVRRQNTLADFGVLALSAADLGAVLDHACRLAARGLNSPVAKILRSMPQQGDLLLCAAVGIPNSIAIPGKTRIPGGRETAAGYTLVTGKPVVSDVTKETRFAPGEVMLLTNIRHSANVPIACDEELYGIFEVDRKDDPPFTAEDIDFLQTFAALIGAAVARQRAAGRITRLLRDKEVLLRELQHRIKNDLQVIVAIIELQLRGASTTEARAQLQSISGRVDSLRLVHDHLYRGQSLDWLDLGAYLQTLAEDRFRMHGFDPAGAIRLEVETETLTVDRDLAMPLGLIANEFMTNSFKYAFANGQGVVRLGLARVGERDARLTLEDTGPGARAAKAPEQGTGLRLIELLTRQIQGRSKWSWEAGTRLQIEFALPNRKQP